MTLQIENLCKTYPNGLRALSNINLEIPRGLYGLLGQNGAGKSTLMRILATLQEATSGTVFLDQLNVLRDKHEVRRILGYLPQEFGVYPQLSAEQMLEHFAILKGYTDSRERRAIVAEMLERVNLFEYRMRSVSTFSGGMKQRFGIAQALLGNPRLLIVDEPTAGLDPGERNRFYNLLADLGDDVIVILSTHIVQDLRELCRNMAIIHRGTVTYSGPVREAEQQLSGRVWQKTIERRDLAEHHSCHRVLSTMLFEGRPVIRVLSDSLPGPGFEETSPTLEDVFFSCAGD
jgi:ABC-type multidrug transport system ATPase subunit